MPEEAQCLMIEGIANLVCLKIYALNILCSVLVHRTVTGRVCKTWVLHNGFAMPIFFGGKRVGRKLITLLSCPLIDVSMDANVTRSTGSWLLEPNQQLLHTNYNLYRLTACYMVGYFTLRHTWVFEQLNLVWHGSVVRHKLVYKR